MAHLRFIHLLPYERDDGEMEVALYCDICDEHLFIEHNGQTTGYTPSDAVIAQFNHLTEKHPKVRRAITAWQD